MWSAWCFWDVSSRLSPGRLLEQHLTYSPITRHFVIITTLATFFSVLHTYFAYILVCSIWTDVTDEPRAKTRTEPTRDVVVQMFYNWEPRLKVGNTCPSLTSCQGLGFLRCLNFASYPTTELMWTQAGFPPPSFCIRAPLGKVLLGITYNSRDLDALKSGKTELKTVLMWVGWR